MQIINEKGKWNDIVNTHFSEFDDIYFKYEYFELFKDVYGVEPEGIFWKDDNIKIFWTHLIRNLSNIEIFKEYNYYDLASPYGFGGPLIKPLTENENELKESLQEFYNKYIKYSKEKRYVTEFIRFHPIFKNYELLEDFCSINYMYDIVIIDLTLNYDTIWENMTKNNRYYTRKAIKEFERSFIQYNPTNEEINEFLELYYDTMDKNKASSKYFFKFDFIMNHFKFGNVLITVKNNQNIIGSTAIFLKGKNILHYHLSATNDNLKNSPSRAVLWHAIEWGKNKGFTWLNLGGGRGTNDDGLFHFKKSFSNMILPFNRGEIIFNDEIYNELSSINQLSENSLNFFPKYRIGISDSII